MNGNISTKATHRKDGVHDISEDIYDTLHIALRMFAMLHKQCSLLLLKSLLKTFRALIRMFMTFFRMLTASLKMFMALFRMFMTLLRTFMTLVRTFIMLKSNTLV